MDTAERRDLDGIIGQVLDAVARECGKDREWLSLEIEQVVNRGVFEAYRVGASRRRRRRSSTALPSVPDED